MSRVPNRISVPTAITDRSKINLTSKHITTGNFMDYMVAKRIHLVPKQSINISHNLFSRLDPLEVPTYGDCTIRSRAFFVPYRTVMPAWNDFIEQTVHNFPSDSASLVPYSHRIKNSQLIQLFMQTTGYDGFPALSVSVDADQLDTADIVIISSNGTPLGYNLTSHGSRCLKLLLQCGIRVDWNQKNTEIYHSAMQLLCLAKVYYDWYYQNQYINDDLAMTMESFFNYDSSYDFSEWFTYDKLAILFGVITKVNYDSDFFVNAWDNPVSPTDGSFPSMVINDITTTQGSYNSRVNVFNTGTGTPFIQRGDGGSSEVCNLSQYTIDALKSLNDFVKRKQLSGARVFDRYLSEFGVSLNSEALKRSIYLTDYIQEVHIGDVTSTSDTLNSATGAGAPLGSYAGKGVSNGNGNIEFETYEFGEFFIISTIIPDVSYYQGQDKVTMASTRFDYFTPDFDAMGVQSLDTREVFMPLDAREQYPEGTTSFTGLNYNNLVFGFVPRYAELKRPIDMITGDYILRSRGVGDPWTLFRNMRPSFLKSGIVGTKHDRIFTTGADSEQYNRLFYVTSDSYDHFKIEHRFKIESSFPGKSLYDDYEFRDEDKAKRVNIDNQGVKAN